ncbi:MAG: hypothetical protein ACI841_001396 [Planctomycetota bacterium]|jgi:hypothetical protein
MKPELFGLADIRQYVQFIERAHIYGPRVSDHTDWQYAGGAISSDLSLQLINENAMPVVDFDGSKGGLSDC